MQLTTGNSAKFASFPDLIPKTKGVPALSVQTFYNPSIFTRPLSAQPQNC
jgi:hypothetical protein